MRRRFAGQIAQPTASAKTPRGGRLGPGSELEREEGSKAAPILAAQRAASTTATSALNIPKQTQPQIDIAGLKAALGIDQLRASLQSFQGSGGNTDSFDLKLPDFEIPDFEVPEIEQPDWEGLLSKYLGQPTEIKESTEGLNQATTTTSIPSVPSKEKPSPAIKKKNTLRIAGQNINLNKLSAGGVTAKEVKELKNRGLTKQQIIKTTETASANLTAGAQKALNLKTASKVSAPISSGNQPKTQLKLASPQAAKSSNVALKQQAPPTQPAPRASAPVMPTPPSRPAPALAPAQKSPAANNKKDTGGNKGEGGGKKK